METPAPVASTCTPRPLAPEGHCATPTPIVHVITGADPGAGDDIDPEPNGQAPVAPAAPALAPHRTGAAWACATCMAKGECPALGVESPNR
jgi:hypothetical protein